MVNPFRITPINDPSAFVGRREAIHQLSRSMLFSENISLMAERRIGATSLLRFLAHAHSPVAVAIIGKVLPIYIDLQRFSDLSDNLLLRVIQRMTSKEAVLRYPIQFPLFPELLPTGGESEDLFEIMEALEYTIGEINNQGIAVCLLFDEFEVATANKKISLNFFYVLRSIASQYRISYIITTRSPLSSLEPFRSDTSSPLSNIFMTYHLGLLEEDETNELICRYLEQAGIVGKSDVMLNELHFIRKLTGYHPFFIQLLGRHIIELSEFLNKPLDTVREEVTERFYVDASSHFDFYWRVSSRQEKDLIACIIMSQEILTTKEYANALRSLVARAIIYRAPLSITTTSYFVFSGLFAKWYLENVNGKELTVDDKVLQNNLNGTEFEIITRNIAAILEEFLPLQLKDSTDELSLLLSLLLTRQISSDEAREKIINLPNYRGILRSLSGKDISTSKALVSFGENMQAGDIRIDDMAGNDIFKITFNINLG